MSTSPPVTSETPLLAEETLFDMADMADPKPNAEITDDGALARGAADLSSLHVDNNSHSSGTQSDSFSAVSRVRVTEADVCPALVPVMLVLSLTLLAVQDRRIRRKTDRTILTILVWVYFLQVRERSPCSRDIDDAETLQILDKTILGYSAIFGLQEDLHLEGNQYSLVGSIAPIAQLAWQPFSSILIVKVPPRILMSSLLLGWGIAQATTSACHTFAGLLIDRFFLGLFEAGCLPLFSIITSQWYRRSEQPLRVAAWYGTNGLATIVAAALSYGLDKINSPILAPWQM
jgi:MFS transporter, ACS family, DAL5 transporter family protein